MKKNFTMFFAVTLVVLLTSCSAVQKATTEADAGAKTLSPPADKALVYVVRPNFLGTAIRFKVSIDGKYVGTTGGQRYIYTLQDPGLHKIASKAENLAELEIEFAAGQVYYIEQIPRMGIIMARNKLVLLDEATGREKLNQCTLSADNVAK
jgi:hypothetical protein